MCSIQKVLVTTTGPSTKVSPETSEENTYEFVVQNTQLIDRKLIYEGLTRERPVAIVHVAGMIGVYVHDSIFIKASLCTKKIHSEFIMAYEDLGDRVDSFVPLDSKKLSRLTAAIKAVRGSQLKRSLRGKLKVRVDLIKI